MKIVFRGFARMRLRFRLFPIVLIGLLLIMIVACDEEEPDGGATAEPQEEVTQSSVQFVPFTDDGLGLSLQHPAGWITQASIAGATVATSQAVIDVESLADIGEEGFVVILPGEIDYFNFQTGQTFSEDDVLQALATYKVLLEREGQEYVTIEPPQSFVNDGQKIARIVLRSVEDGEPLITVMAVVMEDGYMALVSAASLEGTAEEMRPIFERIIESIEVRPPGGLTNNE
jgi:hypothetical protein